MGTSQQADRGLARFFDLSLDAVCISGFDGYLKMANPAFPRMLGCTLDELLAQPFIAHVHPEDVESVLGAMAQLAEGKDVIGFQCRQLCAGGSIRWIEWSASAEPEEGLIYSVGRDVTERRGDTAELGALRRVATLVARGTAAETLFEAVVEEVGGLLPVKSASMGRFDPDGLCTTVAAWSTSKADFPAGERWKPGGNNVTSIVFRTASSARLDDYSKATGPVGLRAQRAGYRSAVGAPITVEGRLWGLLTAESTAPEPLSAETEQRLEKFTDLVATAIANADARESLATLADEQASLRRVAAIAAAGAAPPQVFEAVAEELGRLVDVDRTYVTRIDNDDVVILAMSVAGRRTMQEEFSGQTRVRAGDLTAHVREAGGPVRVDPYQPDPDAGAVEAGLCSVVSAPIMVGDHLWGFVTAGSTSNRPPPASTEQRLARFTELLGSMVANAESRESEALLAEEQAALRRVATLIAQGVPPAEIFSAVSVEVGRLFGSDTASIIMYDHDRPGIVVVGAGSTVAGEFPVGSRWPLDDLFASAKVFRTGRSARVDDAEYAAKGGLVAEALLRIGSRRMGSPIVVEGRLWGAITVSTKHARLPSNSEERLEKFTELVATAVSNAHANSEVARLADEQAALRRVATLMAKGVPPAEIFAAVTDEVGRLFGSDAAWVVKFEESGPPLLMVGAGEGTGRFTVGTKWEHNDLYPSTRVFRTGRSVRVGRAEVEASGDPMAEVLRQERLAGTAASPIIVDGHLWGAITVSTREEMLPVDTERRLERFTELVATAISNTHTASQLARLADEQAALRRVATLVAKGVPPAEVFAAVSDEVGRLLGSNAVWVVKFEDSGPPMLLVGASKDTLGFAVGSRWEHDDLYPSTRVFKTGRSVRVSREEVEAASGPTAESLQRQRLAGYASPINVDGHLWGTITVYAEEDALPLDTERRLERFTELVATAISNTHTASQLARLADEQAALRRVATLVAKGVPPAEIFAAVSDEVAQLFGRDLASVVRFDGNEVVVVGATAGYRTGFPVGSRWELDEQFVSTKVFHTGRSARVDDRDISGGSGRVTGILTALGRTSTVASPIVVDDALWGAITVSSTDEAPFTPDTEQRLERFTELVATAISNAHASSQASMLAREQAALRRVATLVAESAASDRLFSAVSDEVGLLFDTSTASVVRFENEESSLVVVGATAQLAEAFPVGTRWELDDVFASTKVFHTGKPARVEERDYRGQTGPVADILNRLQSAATVATPILVEGRLWGAITVSTTDPTLPRDAEERLEKFTELVATAISNTLANVQLARVVDEQAALRRVATLVAQGVEPAQIFAAVSAEVSGLIGTDLTGVIRFEEHGAAYVFVGVTKSVADALPIGTRWPASKARASAEVFRSGRSARMSERDWSAVGGVADAPGERLGVTSTVASPIAVEGQLWGTVTVSSQGGELPPDTEQRLEEFTALIATAIANAESRRELAASRRRIVAASDEARRRIERDLHDGMQQRLVSLGLAVRAAESLVPHDQVKLRDDLSAIAGDLARSFEELQEISRGIHPAILSEGGLAAALRGLGRRASIPTTVVVDADIRLPEPIEVAVYYVASEALANAAKHAQATRADMSLEQREGTVVLSIRDDGVGGAEPGTGSGLVGLIDRVEALGGGIDFTSPPGHGTTITVEFRLVPDPQDQKEPAG